jgi:hypothetical protein
MAREGNNFHKCCLSYRPGVKRHPWFRHELKYSRLAQPQLYAIDYAPPHVKTANRGLCPLHAKSITGAIPILEQVDAYHCMGDSDNL